MFNQVYNDKKKAYQSGKPFFYMNNFTCEEEDTYPPANRA